MRSTRTLAVTMGIGPLHRGYAEEAARRVERHLNLDTFIIDDRFLDHALDERSRLRRIWTLKLSMFDFVPEHWERLMYFDADWRPVRDWDVDALFPDMDRIYVAPDRNHLPNVRELEFLYDLAPGTYFNSGWMLLPRSHRELIETSRMCYQSLPRRFGDQCVLNQVLRDDVTLVSPAFNVCTPRQWPDPANAMAVHSVNSDWNYRVYAGIEPDRNWNPHQYADPAETVLRGLDYAEPETVLADNVVEIYQAASNYRGGRALEIGAERGHFTLALAMAGLSVTSYSLDSGTAHARQGLLARHGYEPEFWLADFAYELDRDRLFDVVLFGRKGGGNHVQRSIERFWRRKIVAGGLLIVRDMQRYDRERMTALLQPEGVVIAIGEDGSELGFLLKGPT